MIETRLLDPEATQCSACGCLSNARLSTTEQWYSSHEVDIC